MGIDTNVVDGMFWDIASDYESVMNDYASNVADEVYAVLDNAEEPEMDFKEMSVSMLAYLDSCNADYEQTFKSLGEPTYRHYFEGVDISDKESAAYAIECYLDACFVEAWVSALSNFRDNIYVEESMDDYPMTREVDALHKAIYNPVVMVSDFDADFWESASVDELDAILSFVSK